MSNNLADYSNIKPKSNSEKAVLKARQAMYRCFRHHFSEHFSNEAIVLDVGACSDETKLFNNFFELYHRDTPVVALSNEDCSFLEGLYPNVTFMLGDARQIALPDNYAALSFSNAVIEHVGSMENQVLFINEVSRVSKNGFFITTPYRFFPVEMHTLIPLLHWLPKKTHRLILSKLGQKALALEENLNLLDLSEINRILDLSRARDKFHITVKFNYFLGMPSNLLIIGKRR